MTEIERLREALELILPMARGYAHAHPVGSNAEYIASAEAALSSTPPVAERGEWPGTQIRLLIDRRADGRFHIHSPDVPGLHLAGAFLADLFNDLYSPMADLLKANLSIDLAAPPSPRETEGQE